MYIIIGYLHQCICHCLIPVDPCEFFVWKIIISFFIDAQLLNNWGPSACLNYDKIISICCVDSHDAHNSAYTVRPLNLLFRRFLKAKLFYNYVRSVCIYRLNLFVDLYRFELSYRFQTLNMMIPITVRYNIFSCDVIILLIWCSEYWFLEQQSMINVFFKR